MAFIRSMYAEFHCTAGHAHDELGRILSVAGTDPG